MLLLLLLERRCANPTSRRAKSLRCRCADRLSRRLEATPACTCTLSTGSDCAGCLDTSRVADKEWKRKETATRSSGGNRESCCSHQPTREREERGRVKVSAGSTAVATIIIGVPSCALVAVAAVTAQQQARACAVGWLGTAGRHCHYWRGRDQREDRRMEARSWTRRRRRTSARGSSCAAEWRWREEREPTVECREWPSTWEPDRSAA